MDCDWAVENCHFLEMADVKGKIIKVTGLFMVIFGGCLK